ncbi:hypothetical protein D3C83_158080 [compost metagenome]
MSAVFIIDDIVTIQVSKFDITRSGIVILKSTCVYFCLVLKDPVHFIQVERT